MYKKLTILTIAIILIGAGCVSASKKVEPTPTPVYIPEATDTPAPTATATPTPSPTEIPVLTPTPTPTSTAEVDISNWKTYTNKEYGFSFRYPENAELEEVSIGMAADYIVNVYSINNHKIIYDFKVAPPDDNKESLYDYVKDVWDLNVNDNNPNIKDKQVSKIITGNFNGEQVYMFDVTHVIVTRYGSLSGDLSGQKYTVNFLKNNDKIYTLFFKQDDIVSQAITRTFKFTK